ncbi:MAG: four helix bundle protein [Thiohalophilus sp.]
MDKPHKQLYAWNLSIQLVSDVYSITQKFPDIEKFGLSQQLRRAAVSIPSNIAEGAARNGNNEFRHFVTIARGSLSELDTQLDIARLLNYCTESQREQLDEILQRIDKMLYKLHQSLKA